MSKRRRYSDEFRANSVAVLKAEGWPDRKGALTEVAERLNIPRTTLWRWANEANNPAPSELVTEKKHDLATLIKDEMNSIFSTMSTRRETATYRDLGVVFGVLFDKVRLLEGESTQIIQDVTGAREQLAQRLVRIADTERDTERSLYPH